MQTLKDWVISVIGEPEFYRVIENPNYGGTGYNRYTIQNIQYDWSFICACLIFLIFLWGFITLIRMLFKRYR